MKRILTVGLLLFALHFLNANPLVPGNSFVFSELVFNSEGKWEIELTLHNQYFSFYDTEQIYISSKSGCSILKHLNEDAIKDKLILIITNDSLQSDLFINPLGDSISICYNSTYQLTPPLVFGNLVTASIRAPKMNESIALYGYDYEFDFCFDYSIDKSPSIGTENDSTGMCATMQGKIFDPYNLLKPNTWLAGNGIVDFKPDATGNYSTRITSSKHNIDKLYYFDTKSGMSSGYYLEITPVVVTTEPDSIVYVDFYINRIVASTESVKINQESILKISPNPIREFSFNYEIAIPVKSADSYLEIINMNGQKMGQYPIYESKGKINLHNKISNGSYIVKLYVNNKNYANSKILIAH